MKVVVRANIWVKARIFIYCRKYLSMRPIYVILGIILIAGLSFCATNNVSSCQNITSSGVYNLNTTLSGAPNDASEIWASGLACIKIDSDNVLLDCRGFSIHSTSGVSTFAVAMNKSHSNITIQNCRIVNYTNSIFLQNVSSGLIFNNTITNCTGTPMLINYTSSSLNITSNVLVNVSNGIVLYGSCQDCQVRNNYIQGGDFGAFYPAGFYMSLQNGAVVNNTVNGLNIGFFVQLSNSTAANNTASANRQTGFYFFNSDHVLIQNNSASFAENRYLESSDSGFYFVSVTNSTVVSNRADGNYGPGFLVPSSGPAVNLTFINNVANSSYASDTYAPGYGFYIGIGNVVLINNTAYDNDIGFRTQSNCNLTINTAHNNDFGFVVDSSGTGNLLLNNTALNNSIGFSDIPSSYLNRFLNNTADYNLYSGYDIYGANETLIGSRADHNGQTFDGYGFHFRPGAINNTASSNTADYNTLYGFFFDDSPGNNLTGNTAQGNLHYDLYVDATSKAGCAVVVSNLVGTGGQHVYYSNVPVNLVSPSPAPPEIFLCGADGSNLTGVTASGGTQNDGIVLLLSNRATIRDSTSSGNYFGFNVIGSENVSLIHNIADGNNDSGFMTQSVNATFVNNSASGNAKYGFEIGSILFGGASQYDTLITNTASGNLDSGFLLYSHYNRFYANNATSNAVNGFLIKGDYNSFSNDSAIGNGITKNGFNITGRDYNNFTGIRSYGNTAYGVYDGSTGIVSSYDTYRNVQVHDNAIGFYFVNSENNAIIDSTIYGNSQYGIIDRAPTSPGLALQGSRLYNNPVEIFEDSNYLAFIRPFSFAINDTVLGSANPVNISISDSLSDGGLQISESSAPSGSSPSGYSPMGKYLKINFTNGEPALDSLSIHYLASDVASFNASTVSLFIWNLTSWVVAPSQSLNESTRTVSAFTLSNITSDDIYGVFAEGVATPPPSGGGETTTRVCPSDISLEYGCSSYSVTVRESDGVVIKGARVEIIAPNGPATSPTYYDNTNSDGIVTFPDGTLCGQTVTINAYTNSCDAIKTITATIQCGGSACGCNTDADCKSNEYCDLSAHQCKADCQCTSYQACENHVCKNEPCAGGQCDSSSDNPNCHCSAVKTCDMSTRTCKAQCSQDADCGTRQYCDAGQCKGGCSSDDECGPAQYCDGTTHACTDLGCGKIENHNLVQRWDCGGDNCPACASGASCDATTHTCKQGGNLTGPTSGFVGENVTVSATVPDPATGGTKPCAFCAVSVEQGGKSVQVTTDANGKAIVRLLSTGAVKFTLLSTNGVPTASLEVQSLQKTAPSTNPAPTWLGMLTAAAPLLIGLLLIATILFIIWRSRKGEKFKPMRK